MHFIQSLKYAPILYFLATITANIGNIHATLIFVLFEVFFLGVKIKTHKYILYTTCLEQKSKIVNKKQSNLLMLG